MKYKKGESGNPKQKFSKENQPPPENKSKGKLKLSRMKEALEYFAQQFHKIYIQEDGQEVEMTFEGSVAHALLQKALKGDVQAIKVLADIHGWNADKTTNVNLKTDVQRLKDEGDLTIDEGQSPDKKFTQINA